MNPRKSKWLKKYIRDSKYFPLAEKFYTIYSTENISKEMDRFMYFIVQPTGLMYGYPIYLPNVFKPKKSKWDERDKTKLILVESFFRCSLYHNRAYLQSSTDLSTYLKQLFVQVGQYYQETFATYKLNRKWYHLHFYKGIRLTEQILNHRIRVKYQIGKSFWNSFFQNSLLFLDVYYFMQWLKATDQQQVAVKVKHERDYMFMQIMKVIASAAHVDGAIQNEERYIFNHFLDSSGLSQRKIKLARRYLDRNFTLDKIDLQWINSWILKKYLLEIGILTVWSDKTVTDEEQKFITTLGDKLKLDQEEISASKIAVESFVLENWQEVHYLHPRQNSLQVKKLLMQEMKFIADKYKRSIKQEIQESGELASLLHKSATTTLDEGEKEKIRTQIIDLLKLIPAFALIILPGRTVTLPLLLKWLPRSYFPSAFQEHLQEDENVASEDKDQEDE